MENTQDHLRIGDIHLAAVRFNIDLFLLLDHKMKATGGRLPKLEKCGKMRGLR